MSNKSMVKKLLPDFVSYVENQFESHVKIIRSDNGAEFSLTYFFTSKGIVHQTSCVETPQKNDIVERKHQHLLNITRSLLF